MMMPTPSWLPDMVAMTKAKLGPDHQDQVDDVLQAAQCCDTSTLRQLERIVPQDKKSIYSVALEIRKLFRGYAFK
jgi:hypothetical protein